METNHLIALVLLLAATGAGIIAASASPRLREAAFFLLVAGAVLTERLDVNYFTHFWYRGTTRGIELSLIDVLAVSVLLGTLLASHREGRRWFWPAGLGLLLLYFAYAVFSVAISEPRVFGLFELSKILRGIVVLLATAFYVRGPRELAIFVLALGAAVCLQGVLALKQRYLGGEFRVGGSVDDPNSLSMYLCLTVPVLVSALASDLPRWLRIFCWAGVGAGSVSILLTVSRAGVPIFGLVTLGCVLCCVSLRPTPGKMVAAVVVLGAVAALVIGSWSTLKARYSTSSFEEEYLDPTSEGRGYYLRVADAILGDHFFGVGLNNWSYWVSKSYGNRFGYPYEDYDNLYFTPSKEILPSIRYAAPAHCLAALTAGELGWPGLVIFTLLWARWLQAGFGFLWRKSDDAMRQLAVGCFFGVCGLLLQSVTEWTYRQTPIFFTCNAVLGVLVSLHHERRRAETDLPPAAADEEPEELATAAALPAGGPGG